MRQDRWVVIGFAGVLAWGWFVVSDARAAITPGGNTTVGSGTASTYVGKDSAGTLAIDAGSSVTDYNGYVGYNAGASGLATITGAGSKWVNNATLYIGYSGSGTLIVDSGALASNTSTYLGYNLGATGTATVTGPGTQWTHSGSLYVGDAGTGTLTVASGARVTAKTLYASLNDLAGDGTITISTGAFLDGDLIFDSTHGTTQTMAFGSGGSLNLTISATGELGAGYRGTGTLRIADGVSVTTKAAYLGYRETSNGTATITGAGSKWISTGKLYVGNSGGGTLIVQDGGEARSVGGFLGSGTHGGVVTVTGGGSKWSNTGELRIGISSSATLTIAGGGQVTNVGGYLGDNPGMTGNVAVSGAGSTWTSTGGVWIGYKGNGTLRIENGGQVFTDKVYTSNQTGTTSAVTVAGANSKLISERDLTIANVGSGTLTIQDGGEVTNTVGNLGASASATATATVSGMGSKWVNSGYLFVGNSGTGNLTVDSGAQVSNTYGYLGNITNSSGTATLTGAGSKWTSTGPLCVGNAGNGSLVISAGAEVSSAGGQVAYWSSSTSAATVSGAGSKWASTSTLSVGREGNGQLTIDSGAVVSNTTGYLGALAGSTGKATVAGAGSTWTNTGTLYVGDSGSGTLTIESGARVTGSALYVGNNAGSSGTVTVRGAGSNWTKTGTSGEVVVGSSGSGVLNIEGGGQVTCGSVGMATHSGTTGAVTVTGAGSVLTVAGMLSVGTVGVGTLTVNDGATVSAKGISASPGDLRGNGVINVTGSAILDADVVFDRTQGLAKTFSFGSGGTLNVVFDGTGTLGAGHRGIGTVRIAEGIQMTSATGIIANGPGSTGTLTVTGAGSKWIPSSNLYVGDYGNGTLTIEDGAQVSSSWTYSGYQAGSAGAINVTGTGSRWDNTYTLVLGCTGNSALKIENEGQASTLSADIGSSTVSVSTVEVTGAGSAWTVGADLNVGQYGPGSLTISAGGRVTSVNGYIGNNAQASGSVTVTGAGSSWANSDTIYAVRNGTGTLTVTDGGLVTSKMLYASLSNLRGNGTVIVSSGAELDGDLVFDSANGTTAVVAFGSGGVLRLTADGTRTLGVGYKSAGSLRIADGVVVPSTGGVVGRCPGSTGTAIVTGAGSKWKSDAALYVADAGSGSLRIEAGGEVINTDGCISRGANASGTVTVTGAGSKWTNLGILRMADNDINNQATLNIAAGGQATCNGGYLGGNIGSRGTVSVSGTGSAWNVSGPLWLGFSYGAGTLLVDSGAHVTSATGQLGGSWSSSNGTATVTGAGSRWDIDGPLRLGAAGTGTLTVADGGLVATRTLCGSLSDLSGNGTIHANGAVLSEVVLFDNSHGLNQTLPFGSGGTLNLVADGTGDLGAAYKGTGSLRIADGVNVASVRGILGHERYSTGSATVSGSGTRWLNSGTLDVGLNGSGTLTIEGGAQVTNSTGSLGTLETSSGAVTVTGAGSAWINRGDLYVGQAGSGTLTVSTGATVTAKTLYASPSGLRGDGTITANGAVMDGPLAFDATHGTTQAVSFGTGGTLNLNADGTGSLGAGYSGAGSLRIADGVAVSSVGGYLSYKYGSSGSATVTGSGSKWNINDKLWVGYGGAATLTISAGGQVNCASAFIRLTSVVNVTGSGSAWNIAGPLEIGQTTTYLPLVLSDSALVTVAGDLTNSGSITIGAGSHLMVTGAVTHAYGQILVEGTLTTNHAGGLISNGIIQIGNGSIAGSIVAASITNDSSLRFDHSASTIFSPKIQGKGILMHLGPGTTILTGANTYTGTTMINAGTLRVDGSIAETSSVTVTGTSSRFVSNTTQKMTILALNDGTAEIGLPDNASGRKVLLTRSLKLTGAGTLQLHSGGLMIDYTTTSPLASIQAAILAGYHNGDWAGSGITSSVAAAAPSDRAVGYAEAAEVGNPATFMGEAVPDSTTLLVRMTIKGDANLDGQVNFADLAAVARNYNSTIPSLSWSKGDFNFDGQVSFADLVAVAQHYTQALPASIPDTGGSFSNDWVLARNATVPEPRVLPLLAASTLFIRRRRT